MSNHSQADNIQENASECIEARVKWYNSEKGYGFLVPDDGLGDVFHHFSALDAAGCRRVDPGDVVMCNIGSGKNGRQVHQIVGIKVSQEKVYPLQALSTSSDSRVKNKMNWLPNKSDDLHKEHTLRGPGDAQIREDGGKLQQEGL